MISAHMPFIAIGIEAAAIKPASKKAVVFASPAAIFSTIILSII